MSEREDEQLLTGGQDKVINASDRVSDIRVSDANMAQAAAKKKKMIKWGLIGGAIAIVVVLAIVLPIVLSNKGENPGPGPGPEPVNPIPYIYNPYELTALQNTEDKISGYIYANGTYDEALHSNALTNLVSGLHADEKLNTSLFVTYPKKIPQGLNNEFIKNISYTFSMNGPNIGLLTMTDAVNERYSIPNEVVNKPGSDVLMKMEMLGFRFEQSPFSFSFEDIRDSNNVYVHTKNSTLVMMDKFIQMDLQLPSQRMYGLGERVREFQLTQGTWTMWARGADSPYDDGTGGKQVYGVHPFMLVQSKKKQEFFGIWFRNSNAQSPLIKYNQTNGGSTLSYITTGGQIEIVFFIQSSAKNVLKWYHNVIGTPELPPFWAMGWSQASWAYDTQEQVETVVQNYENSKIPLETIWLDIPYMKDYADFSVDTTAFPDLKTFAAKLKDNRQYLVVIIDGGLSADDKENKYYKMAQELGVLIKSSIHTDGDFNGSLVMKVWPDHTVFLDWFHPNSSDVYHQGLLDLHAQVPFDGLWIDMNEATGFTNGELTPQKKELIETLKVSAQRFLSAQKDGDAPPPQDQWYKSFDGQEQNSTYFLPFIPGFSYNGNLDNMSMSLNATHSSNNLTEYDVHNLYGLMMAEHTRSFMVGNKDFGHQDDRPFILSRSTFVGSGKYASHWLGDNWRSWRAMNHSIAGIMNMNMFGIPHVGADVCGFFGEDLDQDMCARWIQLSTFYPFARGHYNKTFNGEPLKKGTEPFNLEGAYLVMARNSIYDRYQYLRHMYTCLYEAMMDGGSCFDPLFYYYPEDEKLFEEIESSFIVGGALKVSPILNPGVVDTYKAYFPEGKWVSMIDYSIITGPVVADLKAEMTVNVHLRPGSLIPFQDNQDHSMSKTAQLIEAPISIIANRDEFGKATGTLLLEHGLSRSEINGGGYEYYTISVQANSIQKQLSRGTHASQHQYLDKVVLVNAEDLKDVNFVCAFSTHFDVIPMNVAYDAVKKALTITYQPEQVGDHLEFQKFRQINYGVLGKDLNLCDEKSYQYQIKDGYKPDLTKSNETFLLEHLGSKKLPDLNITLQVIDTNILNVKWTFAKQPAGYRKQFEVPKDIINVVPNKPTAKLDAYLDLINTPGEPFGIKIQSKGGAHVISITEMLLDQNLNIIDAVLNTTYGDNFKGIFGLGERIQGDDLFYPDGIYSLWNRDDGTPGESGKPPGNNIYGTHPFYMFKNDIDSWVGVFTNLAAAQDWIILNNKETGEVDTQMIAVGGVADLYFIVDKTPASVLSGYLDIVGKPVLIPQWALGWHQCRWGYNTTNALKEMVQGYANHTIPLDTVWSDIDYLFNYRDFTYDHKKFKNLPNFIAEIHDKNMQYVPIIDAGIAMRAKGTYPAYDEGVEKNVYIKIGDDQILVGQVWPKDAAYPDFFNPNTTTWWKEELTHFHNDIAFDGLWEDMNEASDFCGGTCYPDQAVADQVKYHLPYTPTGRSLERQSIPLDAYHYGDIIELDAHSLFGTMQVKATHDWFIENKKRAFIIERSSYAGIGKYGSKWLGDNSAHPYHMGQSVLGIMQMGMFGVPFSGVDICGFGGDTNPELCARWHYLGAFYPFSRNHNSYGDAPQEPYVFDKDEYEPGVTYTDIMRDAILCKYSLIRYYYTQLFTLSTLGGAPFFKPLFFENEYSNDMNAFNNLKYNVMLGDALKLSILSDKVGMDQADFYFPAGTWCNVFNGSEPCFTSTTGVTKTMRTKAQDAYVHLRQGKIVPFQDAKFLNANPKNVVNTKFLQSQPVDLHILGKPQVIGAVWTAEGTYVNDNGIDIDLSGTYNRYQFKASYTEDGDLGKILINVNTITEATKYQSADDKECFEVNQNDYLGDIQFYNGKASGFDKNKYTALIHFISGDDDILAAPVYDADKDRLILETDKNSKTPVCLSSIKYIEIQRSKI